MTMTHTKERLVAVLSVLLLLPGLYFVSANLLKYGLGVDALTQPLEYFYLDASRARLFNLLSPLVLLGSLGLAGVLSLLPVLKVSFARAGSEVTLTASLKTHATNLLLAGLSLGLLAFLFIYVISENFGLF
ncbi:MAG: hypothetical protein EPO32_05370 [Anaerolineae bacterium]|nr:MAG: hypothetical protein EPO32_05370 [Anaerolineae bacterium]